MKARARLVKPLFHRKPKTTSKLTHFRVSAPFGDESVETLVRPFPNYSMSLFHKGMLYELWGNV